MGLPARLAPGAATDIGFCLRYGHIWKTYYELDLEKYSAKPITLVHDEILTNVFLQLKRGTLEMRIVVSRE
jgi:hypothetical protein